MKLIKLSLPHYTINSEPDYKAIGKLIDDEVVEVIEKAGTDRYDPARLGDRYENIENKHIDLFAFSAHVTPELELSWQVIYGFYHSAIEVHGAPVRIDILTIYDAAQLSEVAHRYEGRDDIKRDGFVFNDPANKRAAVLGIIKIE